MDNAQSLALYAQGKDAWNAWASDIRPRRAELKKAGNWDDAARADFEGHEFDDEVDFRGFIFPGVAGFGEATFTGVAGFVRVTFTGAAGFAGLTFTDDAGFVRVTFTGAAGFAGATFTGAAGFGGATFTGVARFAQSTFCGFTTFAQSTFERGVDFSAIDGKTSFSLAGAHFQDVPDFNQAHFAEAPRLDGFSIAPGGFKSQMVAAKKVGFTRWVDLTIATRWSELKRLAVQRHDHQHEMTFFRGELLARRWVADKPWQAAFWFGLAYQVFSGFGRSVFWPVAWWTVSVIGFAWAYLAAHAAAGLAVGAWSSFGFTVAALGKWFDGAAPFSCMAGPADPVWSALGLSLQKGLFAGVGSVEKLNQIHACLFGVHDTGQLAKSFHPVIPDGVSALGVIQFLWSAAMVFLFLLALRNHFRIK